MEERASGGPPAGVRCIYGVKWEYAAVERERGRGGDGESANNNPNLGQK